MSAAPEPTPAALLVDVHTNVAERLRSFGDASEAASAITSIAVDVIAGADFAGLTRVGRHGDLTSLGVTDPLVAQVDRLQYELRSGPCIDVALAERPVSFGDLSSSSQWPEFGRRGAELGVHSMLSYRLFLESDEDADGERVIGGLNLYSRQRDAFDLDQALPVLPALGSYAALAVWGGTMREQTASVERALGASRDIGAAQGILMERFKITRDDAFGLLAAASQASNRKLRDVAAELVDTGSFALPDRSRRRRPG